MMAGRAQAASDEEWARTIKNLNDSFRCGIYGMEHNIAYGAESMAPLYSDRFKYLREQYIGNNSTGEIGLAMRVKSYKEQLGLRPGIESELILDTSLLFKSESRGEEEFTGHGTAEQRQESGDAARRAKTGTIITGIGAIGGIAGNIVINEIKPNK